MGCLVMALVLGAQARPVVYWPSPETTYSSTVVGGKPGSWYGSYFGSRNSDNPFEGSFENVAKWTDLKANPVDLFTSPDLYYRASVQRAFANQIVGELRNFSTNTLERAVSWSGSTGEMTVRHPLAFDRSSLRGTDGESYVGWLGNVDWIEFNGYQFWFPLWYHAGYWDPFGSVVDLNPANCDESYAFDVDGDAQVGTARLTPAALVPVMWHRTPESVEALSTSPSAYGSATCIRGDWIGGYLAHSDAGGDQSHATMWNRTSHAAYDAHPVGYRWSTIYWTNGRMFAGTAMKQVPGEEGTTVEAVHAMIWKGPNTPGIDVHGDLGPGALESTAASITEAPEGLYVTGSARVSMSSWRAFVIFYPNERNPLPSPSKPSSPARRVFSPLNYGRPH